MGRKLDGDDEDTSVFDSASKRPKKDTERGHDQVTRPLEPPKLDALPLGTASEQIRLISMKTPDEVEKRELQVDLASASSGLEPPSLKLRGLSEFHTSTPPGGMGRLAPPRDEKEVRVRHRKNLLMWSAAVLVIGALVMTIVVLLARR